MWLLKVLSFGARQPVTISIKKGKLTSKHFTKDKTGYKILVFKTPFFKAIEGEEYFNVDTIELLKYIQRGSKYCGEKDKMTFTIDHLNDRFSISSSKGNSIGTSCFFPIQTIPGQYQEKFLSLSFQNGYPIYHGAKLDTHILVNSRDLKDFSRCIKNGEVAEFELKNRKFNLHIWESEGGDYHITPRFQVRNGDKLSIKFYPPKKELQMFKSSKGSGSLKKELKKFKSLEDSFIHLLHIHIYARNDCPIWFCEDTDEYALGILQGIQSTQE